MTLPFDRMCRHMVSRQNKTVDERDSVQPKALQEEMMKQDKKKITNDLVICLCKGEKKVKWWFMHELYNISVYFHWISSSRRCHGFRFWNPLVFLSTFFLTFGRSLFLPRFFFLCHHCQMLRHLSLHLLQWAEKKNTWTEIWQLNESLFECTRLSNCQLCWLYFFLCPNRSRWVWDLFCFVFD